MKTLRERLAQAVGDITNFTSTLESLLKDGKAKGDEEFDAIYAKRDEAFIQADVLRDELTISERTEALRRTAEEHADDPPIPTPRPSADPETGPNGDARLETLSALPGALERFQRIETVSLIEDALETPFLLSDAYRQSLNAWARQCVISNQALNLGDFLPESERYLMQTVTDELGGYTVPPDIADEVLRNLGTFSTIRSIASVRPTVSNAVEYTLVQRATGSNKGIFTGTFVGSMVTETPAASDAEQDLKFTAVRIPVRRSRVIGFLSEDEVADAAFDILALLRDEGALNLAILEDQQFLLGNGAAGEVLGLLNDDSLTTLRDISGTTVDTISNTTAARGSESAILALIDDIAAQYRVGPGVAFIGHATTRTAIRGLVSPAGNFVWREELSAAIEASGRAGSLEGHPFHISDHMAKEGTDNNKVLLFGNFRHYRIADRQRLSIRISVEEKFSTEQVGIRLNSRFGGAITNPEAFAVGDV